MTIEEQFAQRAQPIPYHGVGLSVDLYTPDLYALVAALPGDGSMRTGCRCDYLEIFRAAASGLARARTRIAGPLNYHAEGLWVTQPDLGQAYPLRQELRTTAAHVCALGSWWLTHECASKQMAGYSFGTYLPPLFTATAAEVVARNVAAIQAALDELVSGEGRRPPLFLLEIPPLTYVGFGNLSAPAFFRRVTERVPCGLVLDVGHVWTYYRYSGAWRHRTMREFLDGFLEEFPLERVVQLHVAGLASHAAFPRDTVDAPWWIDAHGASIPELLFDMLQQILGHSRLHHLKGIALEVDTKPIDVIIEEFGRFRHRCDWWDQARRKTGEGKAPTPGCGAAVAGTDRRAVATPDLLAAYRRYAEVASGVRPVEDLAIPPLGLEPGALDAYRAFLREEIVDWGGSLRDLFRDTCRVLTERGVELDDFVSFWFRAPRPVRAPYDFFLLKLERFLEFVAEVGPDLVALAEREAEGMRAAYQSANECSGLEVAGNQPVSVEHSSVA